MFCHTCRAAHPGSVPGLPSAANSTSHVAIVVWTVISIRRLPTLRGDALPRDPRLSEPRLELGTSLIVPCASPGDVPVTAEEVVQIAIGHAGGIREHRDP